MGNNGIDGMVVTLSNYRTFFGIAARNLSQVRELIRERDLRTKDREITDDDVDFICEKNAAIQRSAMITVAFAVMAMESYINAYGGENFSRSYCRKYLDKLEVKSKWAVYPRLATGKGIDKNSRSFKSLSRLITLRNRLVHDKPQEKRICDFNGSEWVTELQAEEAVNTVRDMVGELAELDSRIDIEWLDEVESDPFA